MVNDPTAHAEINAIREASEYLKNYDLSDCEIYTSCEPCPMCLGAIYWARIHRIYYGNARYDAKNIGFDDSFIYDEMLLPFEKRQIPLIRLLHYEAFKPFAIWKEKSDKNAY